MTDMTSSVLELEIRATYRTTLKVHIKKHTLLSYREVDMYYTPAHEVYKTMKYILKNAHVGTAELIDRMKRRNRECQD